MSNIKLVCFDLDDTLINEIHSVMVLCKINGHMNELIEIEKRENNGELSWIEADYYKAKLAKGLHIKNLKRSFLDNIKPIENIEFVIKELKKMGIKCILITAGPKQVAEISSEIWGFDRYFGSDYEIMDGMFTGNILEHLGDKGKLSCLKKCCYEYGISGKECAAVGDGSSDIPIFEFCEKSIGLNYSKAIIGKATHYLNTNNLADILEYI